MPADYSKVIFVLLKDYLLLKTDWSHFAKQLNRGRCNRLLIV